MTIKSAKDKLWDISRESTHNGPTWQDMMKILEALQSPESPEECICLEFNTHHAINCPNRPELKPGYVPSKEEIDQANGEGLADKLKDRIKWTYTSEGLARIAAEYYAPLIEKAREEGRQEVLKELKRSQDKYQNYLHDFFGTESH